MKLNNLLILKFISEYGKSISRMGLCGAYGSQ